MNVNKRKMILLEHDRWLRCSASSFILFATIGVHLRTHFQQPA